MVLVISRSSRTIYRTLLIVDFQKLLEFCWIGPRAVVSHKPFNTKKALSVDFISANIVWVRP